MIYVLIWFVTVLVLAGIISFGLWLFDEVLYNKPDWITFPVYFVLFAVGCAVFVIAIFVTVNTAAAAKAAAQWIPRN